MAKWLAKIGSTVGVLSPGPKFPAARLGFTFSSNSLKQLSKLGP